MQDVTTTCARCGRTVEGRPATWSLEVTPRGEARLCEQCSREHLRAIEARLDEAWW